VVSNDRCEATNVKIVITNDDGFSEPGIEALRAAVEPLGKVIIVAPAEPHSFAGHRVTMKQAIQVDEVKPQEYTVHGAPADCTRLALKQLAPDTDWVIAGINPGANLGTDVHQSGTVAAAREAAILGVKSIAISQYIARGQTINWEYTRHHAARIIADLIQKSITSGQYWNVNLPHPFGGVSPLEPLICPLDKNPHDYSYRKTNNTYRYQGIIHDRPRDPGGDVDVCFGGKISVTRLEI
jgi:5'-nucleotidase